MQDLFTLSALATCDNLLFYSHYWCTCDERFKGVGYNIARQQPDSWKCGEVVEKELSNR